MIVPGEHVLHAELLEEREVAVASLARDVEVLIRLLGEEQKPRMVLKDHDVAHGIAARALELGTQPSLLLGERFRHVLRRRDDARVEDDAHKLVRLEAIVIRAEVFRVSGKGRRRRVVADIVVAGHVVERDRAIELRGNALILGDLRGVALLIHQIASDDDERGVEAIGGGDRELEVGGFLREVGVRGVHAELRIAELHEEPRRGGRRKGGKRNGKEQCGNDDGRSQT